MYTSVNKMSGQEECTMPTCDKNSYYNSSQITACVPDKMFLYTKCEDGEMPVT